MGRKQETQPVSAPRKSVGAALLKEAQRSRNVRLLLTKALLRPDPFLPSIPNLPVSELVALLRIAGVARFNLRHFPTAPSRQWYDYARDLALYCLTRQIMPIDVAKAKRAVRAFKPFLPPDVVCRADEDLGKLADIYERQIEPPKAALRKPETRLAAAAALEEMRRTRRPRRGSGKPVTPRGGRAISEQKQRIVAASTLLKVCGERAPEKVTVMLLKELGVSTRLNKVKRTIASYDAAFRSRVRSDAQIPTDNLPDFWLERLGEFFEYWLERRRAVAPAETNAPLRILLQRFVPEFIEGVSPAVVSAPWRSPAFSPIVRQSFVLGEGRFDQPIRNPHDAQRS